jgi:hypothetical protein
MESVAALAWNTQEHSLTFGILPDDVVYDVLDAVKTVERAATSKYLWGAKRGDAFMRMTFPPIEWVIEGLIGRGKLLQIHGPTSVGKSWLTLDLAISRALGVPWAGLPTTQGTTIVISCELSNAELQERMHAVIRRRNVPEDAFKWFVLLGEDTFGTGNPNVVEDVDDIVELVTAFDASLIVFDPLFRIHEGNDSLQVDMARVIGAFDRIRRMTNAAVCFVHHNRVNGNRERGSGVQRDATDATVGVATSGRYVTLEFEKVRGASRPNERAYFKAHDDGVLEYVGRKPLNTKTESTTETKVVDETLKMDVLELVRTSNITVTTANLRQLYKEKYNRGRRNEKLVAAYNALRDEGSIT